MTKHTFSLQYIIQNLSVVIGVVLVWRGVWYILDELDVLLFGGSHIWTALVGIFVGLIILYVPDRNLDEVGKL